ncbi:hypothetical protein [Bradyrhizobium aeschynomenes]|uniref:hypothetical protein n=1 Tax=Bradyrhizobium aeschynomenes TaxID=2734909 RepID=UPI0015550F81|nr:hypothetical protein [Bradyrhizobium aeschynomenes]NPV24509.1 hypothetical protein [Bradyrhizobium aeschynomenes]
MSDEIRMQKTAREAMQAYLRSVTYPVLWAGGSRLISVGSCVLFRHEDRHFLLTALHLFEEYDKETHTRFPYEGLVGPLSMRDVSPPELGQIHVHTIDDNEAEEAKRLDIVAIELLEESFLQGIKQHWSFITIDHFALPRSDSPYFVSGFPREREKKFGEAIGASLLFLQTEEADHVPDAIEDYDSRYDVVLKYDPETLNFHDNNAPVKSPFVGGVSGGPIFRVADDKPLFWSAKSGMRFVGIQTSSTRLNQWIRFKNIHAVARYFDLAIPEIGAAIREQIGRSPAS